MMQITSGSEAICQICGCRIERFCQRLRCIVAGTHSESCCLDCIRKAESIYKEVTQHGSE